MRRIVASGPGKTLQSVIAQPAELAALVARLAPAPAVALDTEFLRERTYRAELCLLQLADAAGPVCVDPLALRDVSALAPLMRDARAVKVMHASRQDMEVLLPVMGPVGPVFDTQVAAALVGLPSQIGYAELVRRLLGPDLTKAHTRTDWSRRPLTPGEIEYALDDVRYLLPLRDRLAERIAELGREEWLREELVALTDAQAYAVDPEQAWLRIKGLRGLDPARERLARALGAWRERRAIERNRPRGWILEDAMLREIVNRVPRSREQLAGIAGMPAAVLRHCGAELLELIRATDVPAALGPPAGRARADPAVTTLVRRLSDVQRTVASELSLSPEVLATRRELEQLAEGGRDLSVLRGWRRAIIGERLLGALSPS